MASAEGQVQNLRYTAAFPLLLNVANEPTYVMALKDGAGLVKKYAMVNVQQYQTVATGDTLSDCQEEYVRLLETSGISDDTDVAAETETVTGIITRIAQSVIDGNSHFYLVLDGDDRIYDVSITDFVEIVTYQEGDRITMEYQEGDSLCTVTAIGEEQAS